MNVELTSACEKLIKALDLAVQKDSVEAKTSAVKEALCHAIAGGLSLPERFRQPCEERYARRLLYQSPALGYTALVMVWAPYQGTPLHDHAGIWCVEGVVEGLIDVTQYELEEDRGDLCRFTPQGTVRAGVGMAGSLIPPFEYHTISNALEDACSVTIHVYGSEMKECCIFEPVGDGWYERKHRVLTLTP
ncbi:MAG: cysteine dioxygenase family protein [Fimbriimonadales bacterium]|nr:cysteine dioxygenase family protein [Fimbriimonadales bacterium]